MGLWKQKVLKELLSLTVLLIQQQFSSYFKPVCDKFITWALNAVIYLLPDCSAQLLGHAKATVLANGSFSTAKTATGSNITCWMSHSSVNFRLKCRAVMQRRHRFSMDPFTSHRFIDSAIVCPVSYKVSAVIKYSCDSRSQYNRTVCKQNRALKQNWQSILLLCELV